MEENKELKVKHLIILANKLLEAHNFKEAKIKCYDALKMDHEDPNIHLILLLANYEVTEIEHLQKCDIDYNSNLYKNVRQYANKELNDELDKYIIDKSSSIKPNEIKNTNDSKGIEDVINVIYSLGLVQYIKHEFKTLFEKPIDTGHEKNLSELETNSTIIMFLCTFTLFIASFMGGILILTSESYYIDSLCFAFVLYMYWTKFIRLNKVMPISEDIFPDKEDTKSFYFLIAKTIKHFILFIISIIVINICFYLSIALLFSYQGKEVLLTPRILEIIIGFIVGLAPGLTINYAYRKIYNILRNLDFILPPGVKSFLKEFFGRR